MHPVRNAMHLQEQEAERLQQVSCHLLFLKNKCDFFAVSL
jgi:hypothetical protein